MLKLAYNHKDELAKIYPHMAISPRNMYVNYNGYSTYELNIESSNWSHIQYVSMHYDNIIGYFDASIDRHFNKISQIVVWSIGINGNDEASATFAADYISFYKMLFKTIHVDKIEFSCVVGSLSEPLNDKLIKQLNGSVIGVFHNTCKLIDNKLYDVKWYEIFNPDKK